jgi:hypothetical protein
MGTQAVKFSAIDARSDEASRAEALAAIAEFPDSNVSCDACQFDLYWYMMQPDVPAHLPEWEKRCRSVIDRCPDRLDRWASIAWSYGSAQPDASAVYERLLAMKLPSEVRPTLLLKLSDAVRDSDPARALRLEREAIHHPEYPGVRSSYDSGSRLRAEAAGDFETALFLDVLAGPPMVTCGNDCTSAADYEFGRYHRIRLGLVPTPVGTLLAAMPRPGTAPRRARAAGFDRMVAARASNRAESALLWFRGLQRRYEEEARHPGNQRDQCICGRSLDVTAVQELIRAAIEDLDDCKALERVVPPRTAP